MLSTGATTGAHEVSLVSRLDHGVEARGETIAPSPDRVASAAREKVHETPSFPHREGVGEGGLGHAAREDHADGDSRTGARRRGWWN
jgi:hypothetical protein